MQSAHVLGRHVRLTVPRGTVTALVGKQGLYGKVDRFKSISANAKGDLPSPPEQHPNIEHDRLGKLQEDSTPRLSAVETDKKA